MDIDYLTEKEAALRYGFSRSWFKKHREANNGPLFIKQGIFCKRILYPLYETDRWFKENMYKSREQ